MKVRRESHGDEKADKYIYSNISRHDQYIERTNKLTNIKI